MPVGGGGGSSNNGTYKRYSTSGDLQWAVSAWPSGSTIDCKIEPYLDPGSESSTFFGWTGAGTSSPGPLTVTISSSGNVSSSNVLPQYASPTMLYPAFAAGIPAQPPDYQTTRTGPFVGGGLGEIFFSAPAKINGWNSFVGGAAGTTLASGFGFAFGLIPSAGSDAARNAPGGITWYAPQRGWASCSSGQVQWVLRSPQLTCWAPFGGRNSQVWQVAETSDSAQNVVLYSVLGSANGNVVVYREQHHWSNQIVHLPVNTFLSTPTPTVLANNIVNQQQQTVIQRWVDSSSYSLVLYNGTDGSVIASIPLAGYGGAVPCYFSPGVTMARCSISDLDLSGFWSVSTGQFTGSGYGGPGETFYSELQSFFSDGTRTGGALNIFLGGQEYLGGNSIGVDITYATTLHEQYYEDQGNGYINNSATIDFAAVKVVPRALTPFSLAPEPNINLNEFASDGSSIYLLSGTLTGGTTGLPTANQEQKIRVSAYSATTLQPIWSVPLDLLVGVGATAKILFLGAHLHLLVYDGTATTHYWLDASNGNVVAPLESVARTNPAGAFSATAGQMALAYGNTLRIYQG